MFTELRNIATVSLGYKSLQNDFFYVNKATIETYRIEKSYLVPILMLRDLDGSQFEQTPTPSLWLFACYEKRGDLRGTGALRYIDSMADRTASEKKQSGKNLTVKEALEAQGGGVWYTPKARPHKHRVWLRKAIGAVYAPFLFSKPVLVDQRLNSVSPNEGLSWKDVAAALTSSLFAYSLEINGAAAMGAGALEAPTKKLRDYPILDLRALRPPEREQLATLAEAVWRHESPLDWSSDSWSPGPRQRALDEWILKLAGSNVTVSTVYEDLRSACLARIAVAEDKKKRTKKRESDSIGSVAESIAKAVAPVIQSRNFPNDFADAESLDLQLTFDRKSLKEIVVHPLLDTYEIEVRMQGGNVAYHGVHPKAVAEAIIRALLWGRSQFSVSTDRKAMDNAINDFLIWAMKTEGDIERAISESALGTGYEDALKKEVYSRLGIHPLSGTKVLPSHIML
jgi:hypothetical protein